MWRLLKILLVLVGLHVMTKEIPVWFWATYWFSDEQPADTKELAAPWCNYALNATVTMVAPRTSRSVQPDVNRRHKAIYNPYLEAAHYRGVRSNCMTCHSMAGYCGPVPVVLDTNEAYPINEIEGLTRTDYVWSVGLLNGSPGQACKSGQ